MYGSNDVVVQICTHASPWQEKFECTATILLFLEIAAVPLLAPCPQLETGPKKCHRKRSPPHLELDWDCWVWNVPKSQTCPRLVCAQETVYAEISQFSHLGCTAARTAPILCAPGAPWRTGAEETQIRTAVKQTYHTTCVRTVLRFFRSLSSSAFIRCNVSLYRASASTKTKKTCVEVRE
jgi:hypothetical protein